MSFPRLLRYAVPIILGIVAIIQFYHTRQGLTRWKGGGYGMYTELNYPHRELWISLPDTSINVKKIPKFSRKYARTINQVLRYPNEQTIQALSVKLAKLYPDSFRVEVWTPSVDPAKRSFCKQQIY